MTLLKNDGSLLPLKKSAKVAFIGPQANFTQEMLSNYEGQNLLVNNHSTIMAARSMGISFTYSPGHSSDVSSTDKSLIPAAVAAAKAADVAVVMVGLCADHCAGKGRTGAFSQAYGSMFTVILHINGVPCCWNQRTKATTAVRVAPVGTRSACPVHKKTSLRRCSLQTRRPCL